MQRQVLQAALERHGYSVDSVADGLAALRRAQAGTYDLAVVDYNLPEISGVAAGRLLHELMRQTVIPRLIALTANPAAVTAEQAKKGPIFAAIIGKSSDMTELFATIDRTLSESRKRRLTSID